MFIVLLLSGWTTQFGAPTSCFGFPALFGLRPIRNLRVGRRRESSSITRVEESWTNKLWGGGNVFSLLLLLPLTLLVLNMDSAFVCTAADCSISGSTQHPHTQMPFLESGSLGCEIPVIGVCSICVCECVCGATFPSSSVPRSTGDLSEFRRTQFTVNNVPIQCFEIHEPPGRRREGKDGADEELIAHLRDELFQQPPSSLYSKRIFKHTHGLFLVAPPRAGEKVRGAPQPHTPARINV